MLRTLYIAAVACLIAFTAAAQTPSEKIGVTDLVYSTQPDKSLYFTGKYQGKPVNLVRKGAVGSGSWTIYTGTMTDRVRLTFDDKKGLQEILAMDKGHRITLNQVGKERVEYRLYAPDRSFIIGSVLYRSNNRWLQGLMKTEAFPGYPALINVYDVTDSIAARTENPVEKILAWAKDKWETLELIQTAHAEIDDDIKSYVSDAGNYWNAPGNEMWKGMLVGAAGFTVKLIGAGDAVVIGSTIAVATPFLVSVGVGVTIGLAADKVYDWASAKNLGDSSSVTDYYNRLVENTVFSKQPPPEVPQPVFVNSSGQALPSKPTEPQKIVSTPESDVSMSDLLDMSEQLDKQDFRIALDIVDLCTRKRDFDCTELQIGKAAKLASGSADKQALAAARQKIATEKTRIIEEARLRAENDRLAAEAAERQRIAQAQERAAQESRSSGFQWGKAGAMLVGASIGRLDKLSPDMQADVITGILKDSMEGQEGMGNVNAAFNTHRASNSTRVGSESPAGSASSAQSAQSNEIWHEDFTIREIPTGRVKTYPGYSTNIPGDVIASKMKSRISAESNWKSMEGIVTEYSGCGECGVGSTITVVVKNNVVIDTHVYTRDQ